MKQYTMGEVSELLGLRPHVLRYWEQEFPLISPKRDIAGRRVYTERDLQLLFRFKYLLHEKRFTLEGAKSKIWEEMDGRSVDLTARVHEMRSSLLALRSLLGGQENLNTRERELKDVFAGSGQDHLFDHWSKRDESKKKRLVDDLSGLDIDQLRELQRLLEQPTQRAARLEPAEYVPLSVSRCDDEARRIGEALLGGGKVGFLTVAGGHGSRLGFEGPKGMLPISPIRRVSLFQVLAERVRAASQRHRAVFPWYIMTSNGNHRQTVEYFHAQSFFGLDSDAVRFFSQGSVPSLYPDGRLVLGEDGGLYRNPNGHGGVIDALRSSGLLEEIATRGIEELSYFQVDNPLVDIADPLFLGTHRRQASEMSTKVVRKTRAEEKLGAIGMIDGKPGMIEYSDLGTEQMAAVGANQELLFSHGSTAVHVLSVPFLAAFTRPLPFHEAHKAAKALIPTRGGAEIRKEDVVKFELFIFDAIPRAKNPLFFEVDRQEEFAPVKNAVGDDSTESCIKAQVKKNARWLEDCGVEVPKDSEGESVYAIEISPLFAFNTAMLEEKRGQVEKKIRQNTLLV